MLSLKKHLLIRKCKAFIDPKYTHTLNKTNQFLYFKNELRQFSEHTLTHVSLMMTKSHCTCTCIKSSKEYACCVWKHNKCAQVSHIMMIWDMKTSNTLIHNYKCLMGTITFVVHHITPTSPKNMLTIILKAFWFFFLLYSLHIFFLNISCMGI